MDEHSRLSEIFHNMKNRCYYQNNDSYKYYGGKGIKICDEWNDREIITIKGKHGCFTKGWVAFKTWALSHGYRDGLTIDRIDSNKDYSPDNCRWVTMKIQDNNKQNNRLITYKNNTKTMAEWCDEFGLNYDTVRQRLNRGWSIEKTFETKI